MADRVDMTPLCEASEAQVFAELGRRFESYCLGYEKPHPTDASMSEFKVAFAGGWAAGVGCAQAAVAKMLDRGETEPFEEEDDAR